MSARPRDGRPPCRRPEHLSRSRARHRHILVPARDADLDGTDCRSWRGAAPGVCLMTALASHLAAFLREHLPHERKASPHTCATYAYSFQLLVCFAACRQNVKPCQLEIEQLDAPLVLAFLMHIESDRGNSASSSSARLAAINSFFRFLEYRLPSCLDQSRRIHAIPMKKTDDALVGYLTRDELQVLLNAPDPHTKLGVRDRAMLH